MKLKLADGRTIDALAVAAHDSILRAVALLEMLGPDDLVWLRSRVSDAVPHNGPGAEADVFIAFAKACDWHLEVDHSDVCRTCTGTGTKPYSSDPCPDCNDGMKEG